MDRNEVTLVGRVPEAVRVRSLQSGSTLGAWRMVVRRRQPGRGARVDTISCVSFEPEVTVAVAEWLPDDVVEVVGSLRRRWWGSDGAKSSGYEVEVHSARRLERRNATPPAGGECPPAAISPRPVRSLLPVEFLSPGKEPGRASGAEAPATDGERVGAHPMTRAGTRSEPAEPPRQGSR